MAQKGLVSTQDLKIILVSVRKNWWIPVLIGALGFFIGYLYAYKQTNVYSAHSQILLKSIDEYNPSSLIQDNGSFYGNASKTYVDNLNEKRVIMSFDMIQKTLEKLNFEVSYYLVGRVRTEEVFSGVPFKVKVNLINNELVGQDINFKITGIDKYEISYLKRGTTKSFVGRFGENVINVDMDILVTKNPSFTNGKVNSLKSLSYIFRYQELATVVSRFQAAMNVENPEYTNILQISLNDVIRERAVIFLDTLCSVYIESTLQSRYEVNKNTLYYIEKQKDEVTDVLNNIEDTLTQFRQDNQILNLSKQGEEYFQQYINYDNTKRGYQLQYQALTELERYIIEEKDPQFLPPSMYIIANDAFLSKNSELLYNLQLRRSENLATATPKNMIMLELSQRIDSLKADMLIYLGNAKTAISDRIKNIDAQIDTSIVDITSIPPKERGLNNIRRKQKVNEDMYMFLLQRQANTIIARASILPQTKVIEKGRVTGIVSPNRTKIYYVSTGIGLIISLLIVLIRIVFFARVESYDELKAVTNLPIVGEIIHSPLSQEIKIAFEHEPKSALAESFRTMRTNLQYLLGDKMKGVIVITSNNPGEGKTFTSINLAAMLAKSDKKVALIELDLHKPRVRKGLGLPDSIIGISTYIIGKSNLEEITTPTHVENLDAILAGPLPPNPSEIVVSNKIRELIDYCREKYDFVIVDTPPVGLISDALVLMKMADVTLFILNTKMAYKHSLDNAHEIVEMNKMTNFGFVLNGVKQKRSKYYYNRYGYRYSYGGGYGGYGSYGSYGSYGDTSSRKKKKSDKGD